jgi:peptide chain release factor subunit 1
MIARADLEALLKIPQGELPFVSLYLDLSVNQQGKRDYPLFFRKRSAEVRKMLKNESEVLERLEASLAEIERYFGSELREETQGLVLFVATHRGIFHDFQLPVPLESRLIVSRAPYVYPLVKVIEENAHHAVVVVEQDQARIFSYYLNKVSPTAELAEEMPGRTKVGGWSQMRYQRHREWHVQQFHTEVVNFLKSFDKEENPDDYIILTTDRNLVSIQDKLPAELRNKVRFTDHVDFVASHEEIAARIRPLVLKEKERVQSEIIKQLKERLASGYRAAGGKEATVRALQEGRVELLVLDEGGDLHGWRCKECGALSGTPADRCSYCNGELEGVDLKDEATRLAEAQKVKLMFSRNNKLLQEMEGIGALLRY